GRLDVSDRIKVSLGYDPAELAPTIDAWVALIHPDDIPTVEAVLSGHLAPHAPPEASSFEMEIRFRHKDGTWHWVQDRGAIVDRTPDGAPSRAIGSLRAVTARHEVDERRRLQACALDHAANGVAITDRAGTMVWVNPAFTAITGYSSDEAVGLPSS